MSRDINMNNKSLLRVPGDDDHEIYNMKIKIIKSYHCIGRVPRVLFLALFISSSWIRCSMRYVAVFMACGLPVIVTMRLRVPGAKMPFFDI